MRGSSFAVSLTLILLMLRLGSSRTLQEAGSNVSCDKYYRNVKGSTHHAFLSRVCLCRRMCVFVTSGILVGMNYICLRLFEDVIWCMRMSLKSITTSQTHLRKGQDPSGALPRLVPKRSHRNLHAKSHTKTRVNITTQNAAEMWCT